MSFTHILIDKKGAQIISMTYVFQQKYFFMIMYYQKFLNIIILIDF